jgi:hypothetical protein
VGVVGVVVVVVVVVVEEEEEENEEEEKRRRRRRRRRRKRHHRIDVHESRAQMCAVNLPPWDAAICCRALDSSPPGMPERFLHLCTAAAHAASSYQGKVGNMSAARESAVQCKGGGHASKGKHLRTQREALSTATASYVPCARTAATPAAVGASRMMLNAEGDTAPPTFVVPNSSARDPVGNRSPTAKVAIAQNTQKATAIQRHEGAAPLVDLLLMVLSLCSDACEVGSAKVAGQREGVCWRAAMEATPRGGTLLVRGILWLCACACVYPTTTQPCITTFRLVRCCWMSVITTDRQIDPTYGNPLTGHPQNIQNSFLFVYKCIPNNTLHTLGEQLRGVLRAAVKKEAKQAGGGRGHCVSLYDRQPSRRAHNQRAQQEEYRSRATAKTARKQEVRTTSSWRAASWCACSSEPDGGYGSR